MPIPSGSVTFAVFRYELAIGSEALERNPDIDRGRFRRVYGLPPVVPTSIVGLNGTASQPVAPVGVV